MKKAIATQVGVVAALMGVSLLGIRVCNEGLNRQFIPHPGYVLVSYPTDVSSHIEFLRYNDGSHQVKIYPTPSLFANNNPLFEDFNGDGLVDRIHENSSHTWGLNKHKGLFLRKQDYDTNKEKFDDADKQLQALIAKYSKAK